jgi:hypothetical protein
MGVPAMFSDADRENSSVRVERSASCAVEPVTKPLLMAMVHRLPAPNVLLAAVNVTLASAVPEESTEYAEANVVAPQLLVIGSAESIVNMGILILTVSPTSILTFIVNAKDIDVFSEVIGFPYSSLL